MNFSLYPQPGIWIFDDAGEILRRNPTAEHWLTTLPAPAADELRARLRAQDSAPADSAAPILRAAGLELHFSRLSCAGQTVVVAYDLRPCREALRAKTEFLSVAAHELRNPVTTIRLYTALLRQNTSDKWPEYLEAIEQEATRQARLVEELLWLARLDDPDTETQREWLAVDHLILAAVTGAYALSRSRDVALRYPPPAETLYVSANAVQFTEALEQVLDNALHYTLPGGSVTVTLESAEQEGRLWAGVAIADTGIGIPEAELPKIFERFFRGAQPRELEIPGNGLGLAIVKQCLERQSGQVTVESQVGSGTRVTLWLPCRREARP